MSKLCGVWHFDSRPVSPRDEAQVHSDLRSPHYNDPHEHRDAGLLMGWAAGAAHPRVPELYKSSDGSVCLWDGRLDNRQDLAPLASVPPDSPDSALVLDLYRRKGLEGLGEVVGDWSLCLWDAQLRRLLLASDYAGIRPLYYHHNAHSLYWSSSLADLARWTGTLGIDDRYAGAFLLRGAVPGLSPYTGIYPVPSGHALIFADGKATRETFWSLPLRRETCYRDEREYEERMLALFRESVQARIAIGTPVCAELSGGLDSSSVVSMADRLRRQTPTGPALHTFSYTHENCPDEKYFCEVERVCGLAGTRLEIHEFPPITAGLAGAAPAWWEARFAELARQASVVGAGVFLTGQFGDLITGNTTDDSVQVAGWLARGRLWRAAREAYAWGRAMQAPLYPILWRGIREAFFSWVPSTSLHDSAGAIPINREDSLVDSVRTRVLEDERQRLASAPWNQARPGRRRRFRSVGEVLDARILQAPEALQHLSFTHPFAHRPLVEFLLTVPTHLVCAPNQPRRLMRRAFSSLLPPLVLGRKSKAAFTAAYVQALMPLASEMLRRPGKIQLVERGYAERGSLSRRLEKFSQGLDCNESQLRLLILFENWLRTRAGQPAAAASASELALS